MKSGQIRNASIKAPYGRPRTIAEKVEVVWTLDAGLEDLEVYKLHGKRALRQVRILRPLDEAIEQGGASSLEDLAYTLGVDVRTIKRDMADLRRKGFTVATRGKLKGARRGQSHKVIIVGMGLDGLSCREIERLSLHSISSIRNYISSFGRVVTLHRRGFSQKGIAFVLGISRRLVDDCLSLYAQRQSPQDMANHRTGGEAGEGVRRRFNPDGRIRKRDFKQAIIHLLETDYKLVGSHRVIRLIAKDIERLQREFFPDLGRAGSGNLFGRQPPKGMRRQGQGRGRRNTGW